jgi:hypothetical protein
VGIGVPDNVYGRFWPDGAVPFALDRGRYTGYQFHHQSLRFFGSLHDADIAEILGVDTWEVRRDWAQAKARFRQWLSS